MLKSDLITNLNYKHKNLSPNDIETIINIFFKKIVKGLSIDNNIEIRGFGSFKKKINKSKLVRNPKTNEKIFKENSFKVHFKIGKTLHQKINQSLTINE
tara:strand:- start:1771 stop:2067 length:297 start_codon:yes stop_codon:yes gene_type:complete